MQKDLSQRVEKKDLEIFKDEFSEFLPDRIYNFHIHLWREVFLKYPAGPARKIQHPFLDDELLEKRSYSVKPYG